MTKARSIRLTVPGRLVYRDVAIRAVMEACSLVGRTEGADSGEHNGSERGDGQPEEPLYDRIVLTDNFDVHVVTAFGEIFNNIAIHAYAGARDGDIEIQLEPAEDGIVIRICDDGSTFDIGSVPAPEELPVGGMGIHLAKMMLDDLLYEPGPPNVWTLVKRRAEQSTTTPGDPESDEPASDDPDPGAADEQPQTV